MTIPRARNAYRRVLPLLTLVVGAASLLTRVAEGQATLMESPKIEWPRIEISVAERRLWVLAEDGDTLRSAPVAVGSEKVLRTDSLRWTFRTPLGETWVSGKEVAPAWVPPDWHFVEVARARGLRLAWLRADQPVTLSGERQLVVREQQVGIVGPDSVFHALSDNDEIVIEDTLYIPPIGTRNRRRHGVLGPYRLRLANGIDLHGTPDKASIGSAATHGCIRLHDEDITWLYANIPVGTRILIR